MPQPNKIPLAFAASGDKNAIPESTETTGLASWRDGFPAITSTPFAEGGIAPKRADFNGIFYALSQAVMWLQQGGVYVYDVNTDYEAGNVVLDAGGLYVANAANGPSSVVVQPSADTTGATWKLVRLNLATQIAAGYMSAADKTKLDGLISTDATPSAAGYMSGADKTKLDGLISTDATQSAAGYMSAEDKTALDTVPTTYFPLAGGTITGQTKIVTTNNGPGIFQIANSSITKGTAPNNAVYASLGFFGDDQTDYTRRLGVLETVYNPDKSVSVLLGAYKANTATDTEICTISCNIDAAGNVSTYAPTPATADVSTKIATTAYVDAHASNVQAKTLSPTSAVTTPHYSSCVVQNHVCFVELSFDLATTPANWTEIKIFDLPVTPTKSATGLLNNQDGSVGGLFFEARTDGGLYMRFTGGSLPTNSYYHGGIVFPC